MSLTAGSVVVQSSGSVTGSDAAERLYNILIARAASKLDGGIPSGPDGAAIKKGFAELATDIATWMVAEIKTYAKAVVSTSSSGLQTLPASLVAGEATEGPDDTVELSIT